MNAACLRESTDGRYVLPGEVSVYCYNGNVFVCNTPQREGIIFSCAFNDKLKMVNKPNNKDFLSNILFGF